MLFNSPVFIALFLPLAWCGYRLCALLGTQIAKIWLIIASLCFYAWWNTSFTTLLCGSILFNYFIGLLIIRLQSYRFWQSFVLISGVTLNLLVLCFYKYLFSILQALRGAGLDVPFIIPDVAFFLGIPFVTLLHFPLRIADITLPLGISFFTFTQIGYLVDCKGNAVKDKQFPDYALFVTFFPHLIAGPILYHREMIPQFTNPATYRFNFDNVVLGLAIFLLGLAKKVVIADYFAVIANTTFSHVDHLSLLQAWSGTLSFTLQIYFDFSGYSEMAMGLALLFNLRFPANFDSPFKSTSIIEFWQRWHMTLTRYLTNYLYNPMALWIRRRRVARGKNISHHALTTVEGFGALVAFPTIITMMLAGIWHGAGLQYLVFGTLHGLYLTINHAWRIFRSKTARKAPHAIVQRFKTAGNIILTITAVIVANVFFRAVSVNDSLLILHSMLGMNELYGYNAFDAPPGLIEQWLVQDNRIHYIHNPYLSPAEIANIFSIVLTFLFIWTMPNILQIFSPYTPSLSIAQTPPSAFLRKCPSFILGIIIGLIAILGILNLTNNFIPFIYFKF